MTTHICPTSNLLFPVLGLTFLAIRALESKRVVQPFINSYQDLNISLSLSDRMYQLTLLCMRTPPLLELAS